MTTALEQKVCETCDTELALTAFSTDRRYKDGRKPVCDACIGVVSANGAAPDAIPATEPSNRVSEETSVPLFEHRINPAVRTKDKVAIVGFTDHREHALALGDDFELWGLNELYNFMPVDRFDRWLEIHPREALEVDDLGKKHLADLASLDIPIYMHGHHEDIPASMPFPKAGIEQALDSDYFTSTPAWMIGMAIAMGFSEIHVYGVDMAQDTEYQEQRACCEHWLGFAAGAGIVVHTPDVSDLLSAIGQYGFGVEGSLFAKKLEDRIAWLHRQDNDRLTMARALEAEYADKSARLKAEFDQKHGAVIAERNQIVGGIQDCTYWQRSWSVKDAAQMGGQVIDRSKDPKTGIESAE